MLQVLYARIARWGGADFAEFVRSQKPRSASSPFPRNALPTTHAAKMAHDTRDATENSSDDPATDSIEGAQRFGPEQEAVGLPPLVLPDV